MAATRGCGVRIVAGIYAECGLSENGQPVEAFLIDPPNPTIASRLDLTAIGVRLVEVGGVHHVADVVGSSHYPNVLDFVEEVRRLGVSRRLPRTLDFAKLTAASRMLLLHSRAYIDNHDDYFDALLPEEHNCPKGIEAHALTAERDDDGRTVLVCPSEMCAGLWWNDVTNAQEDSAGEVERTVGSTRYMAHARPAGVTPRYRLAAFANFPITNLTVIRDREAGTHIAAEEAAMKSALPVITEDN